MSSSRTRTWRVLAGGSAGLTLAVAFSAAALAGTVEIKVVPASGKIEVDAKDVPVDEILKQLGSAKGIAVERIGEVATPRTWSGHVVGRVDEVLARVLESENYVLEHSSNAKSGITRIRVFAISDPDDTEAAVSTQQAPAPASPARAAPPPQAAPPQPRQAAASSPSPPAPPARAAGAIVRSGRQPASPAQPSTQIGAHVRGGLVQ